MAIASDEPTRFDIPDEPGQWVELYDLGFADLDAAVREASRRGRADAADWGDLYPVILDSFARQAETQTKKPKVKTDPYTTHDLLTLLDRGVHAWSYRLHLPARSSDPRQQAERLAALGRLQGKTPEWIARTLLERAHVENAWGADEGPYAIPMLDTTVREVEDDDHPLDPTAPLSVSRWTGSSSTGT